MAKKNQGKKGQDVTNVVVQELAASTPLSSDQKAKIQVERVRQLGDSLKRSEALAKELDDAQAAVAESLRDLATTCGVESVQIGSKEYSISHRGDLYFLKSPRTASNVVRL